MPFGSKKQLKAPLIWHYRFKERPGCAIHLLFQQPDSCLQFTN